MRRWLPSLALVMACAGNPSVDPRVAATQGTERAYRIQTRDSSLVVDQLTVAGDTLRAVARPVRPGGPRAPVVMPVSEIVEIHKAHPDQAGLAMFALPIALFVGLMVSFTAGMGND